MSGTTADGETLSIQLTLFAPGVFRVLLEDKPDPQRTRLTLPSAEKPAPLEIEISENQVYLVSDLIQARVCLDPFHLAFYGQDGHLLLEQNHDDADVQDRLNVLPFGRNRIAGEPVAFHDSFTAEPDEHYYGFGEKCTELDKRGQQIEMWVYDAYGVHSERAYKAVPFFLSSRGYGIFVDSLSQVVFDMAHSNHSAWMVIVPDTALDYYVIAGPHPKEIIQRYASLVSLPVLPPKWSLGVWISSGFQPDSAEAAVQRARRLRELDIPCDVLHLDCYWQQNGRWSDLVWDADSFPDPEGMLRQIKALGYKVCLWINPYLSRESPRFVEAREKGYLLQNSIREVYVGDTWGGYQPPVGILDVTNPAAAAWFKGLLSELLHLGVDSFKSDFGEGVPAEVVAWNGMTGRELHNLYPLLYNDLVLQTIREQTGRNGPIFARSTYAGGQRHVAQWGGDSNCTYTALASTLRGGLSLAMCGHPFWSHDIGGFHRQPTSELYNRWVQFGMFSPIARAHGMTSRLPWDYGEEAVQIFRNYARLRYRLAPYLYTYACLAAQTSLPILRPMLLEYPDDPNTFHLDLQYLLGEELLVAPIYNTSGERSVYFPAGTWFDYWTGERIDGPQTRFVHAPLHILPIYVKANALLPTTDPGATLDDAPFDKLTFDAYLLDIGRFSLLDTDGLTLITARLEDGRLDVQVESPKSQLGLRLLDLPGTESPESVTLNGQMLAPAPESALARKAWWGEFATGRRMRVWLAE